MSAERIENTMRLGERLRQERLRRHLSQEALAEALGASPKSISRWEHEQVVPQAYARLQLCRFFGLHPEDLFVDSEAQALPTRLWGVPSPRNPFFTGREELLQQIHTYLCADQPAAQSCSRAYACGTSRKCEDGPHQLLDHRSDVAAPRTTGR